MKASNTLFGACAIIIELMIISLGAVAHGGGMDNRGCHRDTQAGNYHCHSGPHEGRTFESKADYPHGQGQASESETSDRKEGQGSFSTSRERSHRSYDRDDYHSGWRDRDGDCQDTRDEVLVRQSREPVTFESSRKCEVVSGNWYDPYSGKQFQDPSKLDIEHLVPLAEVHDSGGAKWSSKRKHAYANDLTRHPRTLIAVSLSQNRSKGSRGPSEWMPSNEGYRCDYLRQWKAVKDEWDLSMDGVEKRFIESQLDQCLQNSSIQQAR